MFQSFAVVAPGKARNPKRDRVGFDQSLRTNSKFDAKYLRTVEFMRASACPARVVKWSPNVGVTTLVKVGPRVPKLAIKLAQLQDKFNNR